MRPALAEVPQLIRSLAAAAFAAACAAPVANAADPAVEEVQQCARRNLPAQSAREEVVLESFDVAGPGQRIEAELLWRRDDNDRSQVRITVEAPPDLRGAAFLMLQREGGADFFSYLPELRTVRRLTGRTISGSLFGTDFSYEDVERLEVAAAATGMERLPDAEVDGRPVHVLATTPAPDTGSAYARVVSYVDRETCVVLRADLESRAGTVAKQITAPFSEVKQVGTRWVPHQVAIEERDTGRRTQLTVRKIDLDGPVSRSEFSEAALTKGR